MTQNTNLNVSPYFDDFSEDKNYNKVLFKPGFPVQSRELTTLQSILQGQIEKFGQHFFKEGSMIVPGGIFYDSKYFAVKLDPTFLDVPVTAYLSYLKDNKIEIQGETSGVKATVVNCITASESIDNADTLYIKYTSSGTDNATTEFTDGETLITLEDIAYSSTVIPANNPFARAIVSEATKIGSSSSINEGVFFVRGYFVKVLADTVILDQYTNLPSYKVGLQIAEDIISASSENIDLFDNAKGFSNESAPGADRLRITATLVKKSLTDNNDANFVELLRVEGGIVQKLVNKTDYGIFKEELARRTYDESGDYYVKKFSVDIRETLNNRLGNKGIYLPGQLTQNGNTPSDELFSLQVSSGKAYVRGYEIDKVGSTSIDNLKPRTTKKKENISVPIKIGNNIQVENVFGSPSIGFQGTASVELRNRRLGTNGQIDAAGDIVGIARVYDFNKKNIAGVGTERFDLKLFDIQTFTSLTIGLGVTAQSASHVKGVFSGATGHLTAAIANGTGLNLTDVQGDFQINEPIEINGVGVGRNITAVTDNDIRDVKSIGTTSGTIFACNVALQKDENLLPPGSSFRISVDAGSGSEVTSPSVADFRQIPVKVNDIVKYSVQDQVVPTFNRVSAVNPGSLTLVGINTVVGVCTGNTVTAAAGQLDNVTDFAVIAGVLERGNRPGKTISLPNAVVSSINLLDSSYIIRRQATLNVTGTLQLDFDVNDFGDDNLFLEPYSQENYSLTYADGHKEIITEAQVELDPSLKTITFKGLSKTGNNAILTVTCKRSTLNSKTKTITRCANLIVDRSKFGGAGIGSTTFNDGLTNGVGTYPFGTRVQDETISLNVPEVTRVLGVFESNDTGAPTLPRLTVSNQSDTFSNNVIPGEQIIGAESGAVARVVAVAGGNEVDFVYENDKKFELLETISLQLSGISASVTTIVIGDRDITKNYILDSGQRKEFCDFARINRKAGSEEPTRQPRIIFDHIATSESSGTVESVNSYNNLDYSTEIPFVGALQQRASDFIDLRPRVNPYVLSDANTTSPFVFGSRAFTNSRSETAVSNKTLIVDYSHYLGRIDRLYLTKEGDFLIKRGEPSEFPKLPVTNSEGFEVGQMTMAPYMFDATFDTSLKLVPHKRFTMKDIGSIENRVKNLENYTTLSLLETDTKNLSIKDPNTGLDKFKSGFFVDNFRNHSGANLKGESKFDIDLKRGEMRPRSTERNVKLQFETVTTQAAPANADYAWADDFADANATRRGPALTLNFEEVEFIDQPLATRTENLNPYHIALYAGSIDLSPATDHWVEEIILPTPDIVQIDSVFNGMAELLNVEDRENGGMAASWWNSSEFTWNGDNRVIDSQLTGSRVTGSSSSSSSSTSTRTERGSQGIRQVTTTRNSSRTTTTFEDTFLDTSVETGTETIFGLELSSGQEEVSLGDRVIGVETIHNCRSRNIWVTGKKLKPNTKYYVFMESVDMNEFCVPKELPIEMIRGSFKTSDIVETIAGYVQAAPSILFRTAQHNHETGPYNAPITTREGASSSYSGTSEIINIDLPGISNQTDPRALGYVKKGMIIANQDGTAEAKIGDIQLITDDKGEIQFSLHIPDPTVGANPKFTTGTNTVRLTSSPTNASILDPGGSSAETEYQATGYATSVEEQVLSIKTPEVDRRQVGTQDATRLTQDTRTQTRTETSRSSSSSTNTGAWYDPLAQSFLVDTDQFGSASDGVYVTGGDLFFKTKDPTIPVTVQIRTMRDGTPTTTIVPFGQVNVPSVDVKISQDGSVATPFKFDTPVYLQSGYEYALVLVAPTEKYLHFITRMGEEDLLLKSVYNKQPYLGSLFKSQNQSTWTPSQLEDLKFKLKKAKFVTNTPVEVSFFNTELPVGKIRKENPVTAYSKRQTIGITTTSTPFGPGNEIEQGANNGKIFASGGPLSNKTSPNESILGIPAASATAGVGLTPTSGSFVYTGIGFTSLTGFGVSCVADVTVQNGAVSQIQVKTRGAGYQRGDLLLMNQLGSTGSGVRATVGVMTETNVVVVDNVKNTLTAGVGYKLFNDAGDETVMPAINYLNNDPIRDGKTMLFDHHNHGMHSSQNRLRVYNVQGDVPPTTLSAALNDGDSVIKVVDGTAFATFEGAAVSNTNPGYLLIDKEIIEYKTISGNDITIDTRNFNSAVTDSLFSNHAQGTNVFKYEFNGVSLLKVNKVHNIDPRAKTFNSYHVSLSDATKTFEVTKTGGGDNVEVTQNMPFEYINPNINIVSPSGTSVSARIRTTSGTSISGNEASFTNLGYEPVTLNQLNRLDSARIVASKQNESDLLSGEKSFELALLMSTTDENVSPMIDLDTTNIIAVSNLVDDPVDDYTTDSRVNIAGFDPNSGLYETKRINLEFTSNSLFVQFDAHRMGDANIRVFYKLFRNDETEVGQSYVAFNGNGFADKTVQPNEFENSFSEYKYTAENTPQFNGFQIKIVMTSTNQAEVPRIKNFRAIALRTFDSIE